jgi:hypothetical protein
MSPWHKRMSAFTFLVLLAVCVAQASGGSVSASSASAAQPAPPASRQPSASEWTTQRGVWTQRDATTQRYLAALDARTAGTRGELPVLVIPAKEMDSATYGRIVEDLSIMSRIIEKGVREAMETSYGRSYGAAYGGGYGRTALNVFLGSESFGPPILRSAGGRPKAIYVGGYGAVFAFEMDLPLVAPPEAAEPNQTSEKKDPVWTAAQRELVNPGTSLAGRLGAPQGRPYRPDAVETLRTTLVSALKHATNIRDLAPESWLTILVQGPSAVASQPQEPLSNQPVELLGGTHTAGRTMLTLRAKKADVDQFAKGQLDETQFRQRVQIVAR